MVWKRPAELAVSPPEAANIHLPVVLWFEIAKPVHRPGEMIPPQRISDFFLKMEMGKNK